MRLPLDLVALCIAYLDLVESEHDVLAAFPDARERDRIRRVWIGHTRIVVKFECRDRSRFVDTFVNGVRHSLDDEPARIYTVDNIVIEKSWYRRGEIHRDNDLPAVVYHDEKRCWYRNGLRHRDNDQPAVVHRGHLEWYHMGELHREGDLPASVYDNGDQFWYKNDKSHRDGDRPAVMFASGTLAWCKHGVLHREGDRPAKIYDSGVLEWYQKGTLHRDGGRPAVIRHDGTLAWYVNGIPQMR